MTMVDIRRAAVAAGWTPASATPSGSKLPKAWWAAGSITGIDDGEAVASWPDDSGNSYSLAEATNGPTFNEDDVNGLPSLSFNGSSNYMTNGSLTIPSQTHSLFLVVNPTSTAAAQSILRFQTGGGYVIYPYRLYADAYVSQFGGTPLSHLYSEAYDGIVGGSWQVGAVVVSATGAITYVNDVEETSVAATITSSTSGTLSMGRYAAGAGAEFFGGKIAEALVYDVTLNATDRAAVNEYLMNKYGIT